MTSAAPSRYRIASMLLVLAVSLTVRAQNPLLPSGVAYDASGNLYFADTNRHQVFESTLAGALLVVAGNGTQAFSGDGGPATAASLDSPQSVAVASNGTIYIADTGNQRIRAITTGTITTLAGTGAAGFAGDSGPASAAIFSHPNALAIDSTGALLICDSGNHRIRRIASGIVTTVAGSGVQGFSGDNGAALLAQLDTPSGITVAADGRIFLADTHNHRIRVIDTSGNIRPYAGTGIAGYAGDGAAATLAQLALPRGLFATSTGVLLIADSNNQRIRQIDAQGVITTVAGSSTQGTSNDGTAAAGASLNTPRAVALSSFSAPVFADTGNQLVRELVANGNLYAPAGLVPSRSSRIGITPINGATYGQSVASVTVTGMADTPQGNVQLMEGGASVAQAALVAGTATFATAALPVGAHTLTANYLGDGVNPAATSSAVSVTITQTVSVTTLQPTPASYSGLPLVLTANVASTMVGTPTGTVTFTEGGALIAASSLKAGMASGVDPAPAAGTHTFVATYSGDGNFLASTSAPLTATVGAMPDFTVASSGSATQTVLAGGIAVYNFMVASQPAPFTGAISMSVGVLPVGVTAAFSPPQVIPGTGVAQVTLTLQTSASMVRLDSPGKNLIWFALLLPVGFAIRRRRRCLAMFSVIGFLLISAEGCGDRTLSAGSQANLVFPLTVSGTGTNLVGTVLVHNTPITLIVQ